MNRFQFLFLVVGGMCAFFSCQPPLPQSSPAFAFQPLLSDYGFFSGPLSELEAVEGVLPYELNSPLFTDYAHKKRFIVLPKGQVMQYTGDGLPEFPIGTILIKHFFYLQDERNPELGKQMVETRFLVKEADRWQVGTYIWNEEQTDAEHQLLGAEKDISWIDQQGEVRKVHYQIPDNNDCKSCHRQAGAITPIGPKIRNLNRPSLESQTGNQLQNWASSGYLTNLPADKGNIAQLAVWDDPSFELEQRARAYLEINCAHCHSAQGPANNTALNLNIEETDPHKLGFCKGPVSAAQGSGDLRYDIVPGNAMASIVHFRMNSTETGVAMPELGKSLIHEEGVALIREWINSMEQGACL